MTLPAGTATLTFQARWNIEDCGPDPCDYAYVEVDDGSGWTAIPGSIAKAAEGNGIDGWSEGWKPATFDLSKYAGKTIGLRLAYRTDGAAQGNPTRTSRRGIFADAFKLTSGTTTVFEDGAESGNNGWTPDGFSIVGATTTTLYDHYYIASNRQYVSYDKYLQTGPYNFGWLNSKPDWVEHFPYQNGLLVSYWDTSFSDNNESEHPGRARSCRSTRTRTRSTSWTGSRGAGGSRRTTRRSRSRRPTRSPCTHNGQASYIRGQDALPVFDDRKEFWNAAQPNVGVKVPHAGVRMRVVSASGTSMRVRIDSIQPAQ